MQIASSISWNDKWKWHITLDIECTHIVSSLACENVWLWKAICAMWLTIAARLCRMVENFPASKASRLDAEEARETVLTANLHKIQWKTDWLAWVWARLFACAGGTALPSRKFHQDRSCRKTRDLLHFLLIHAQQNFKHNTNCHRLHAIQAFSGVYYCCYLLFQSSVD